MSDQSALLYVAKTRQSMGGRQDVSKAEEGSFASSHSDSSMLEVAQGLCWPVLGVLSCAEGA